MPLLEKDKTIMENKTLERLELNKILAGVASFAVLPQTKEEIMQEQPAVLR